MTKATSYTKPGFIPPLMDRLFDDDPLVVEFSPPRLTLEELKAAVAKDLEALLNSRRGLSEETMRPFLISAGTVLSYGMPDFVGRSLASPADRNFICRSLERTIITHERRLQDVRVNLDLKSNSTNSLHFRISALLNVRPAQELVNFDALLQPMTQQYSISQAQHPGDR